MLNLAEHYWSWKSSIVERIEQKRIEAEEKLRFMKKYGEYVKKALTLHTINKEVSKECTRLFVDGIESGIYSVEQDNYRCTATFNNGWKVNFWKENKMYAYAQDSIFTSPDGKKHNFSGCMPDKWCLFYILDKIENHRNS